MRKRKNRMKSCAITLTICLPKEALTKGANICGNPEMTGDGYTNNIMDFKRVYLNHISWPGKVLRHISMIGLFTDETHVPVFT